MKAKPQCLSSSEDGTAGRLWNYTTTLSVENVLEENFFQTIKQNLMPGDKISVRQTVIKGRLGRMLATLTLYVTEVTATAVKIEQIGETITFKHEDIDEAKPAPVVELYAQEGWTVKHAGGNRFIVLDDKGKPVTDKISKDDANLIVSGNKAITQKVA